MSRIMCLECNGSGHVATTVTSEGRERHVMCLYCNVKGYIEWDAKQGDYYPSAHFPVVTTTVEEVETECSVCDGEGYLYPEDKDSSDILKVPCFKCNGTGKIQTLIKHPEFSMSAVEVVHCKNCAHRGYYTACSYFGDDEYCSRGKSCIKEN